MQALLHPARVALGALVLAALEPDELEQLLDALLLDLRGHAVELGEVAQVVVAGEPLVDAALAAEDVPDALPHLARVLDDVVAEHARGPGRRDQQRDQHLDRGRLARAVRAEQAEELALLDLEADAADRLDLLHAAADRAGVGLVGAVEVLRLDDGHAGETNDSEPVSSLSPRPRSAAPEIGLDDGGRRLRERVRERARVPVPLHLPAQRAWLCATDSRPHRRGRSGRGNRVDPVCRSRRRPDRRQAHPYRRARPPGDRLRRLPLRARALGGVPVQRDRRDRQRRLLAEPVGAHHRADSAGQAARILRAPAGDAELRGRARRRGRGPDRDDLESDELHGPLRPRRGHVSRLRRRALVRPRPGPLARGGRRSPVATARSCATGCSSASSA